jgi:hypothetical protein
MAIITAAVTAAGLTITLLALSPNKPPKHKITATSTSLVGTTTRPPAVTTTAPTTTRPPAVTTTAPTTTLQLATTTTHPAPTTTHPAPTTTHPAPTTTHPAPTTTRPATAKPYIPGVGTDYAYAPPTTHSKVISDGFLSCDLPVVVLYFRYADGYAQLFRANISMTTTHSITQSYDFTGQLLPRTLVVNYTIGVPNRGITSITGSPTGCSYAPPATP